MYTSFPTQMFIDGFPCFFVDTTQLSPKIQNKIIIQFLVKMYSFNYQI